MADIAHVSDALVTLITETLYPYGPGGAGASAIPAIAYPGWPEPSDLNRDLGFEPAGPLINAHVSVWGLPSERNTTRWPSEWSQSVPPNPLYAMGVVGQVVTVTGAGAADMPAHNFVVGVGVTPFTLHVTTQQTPSQIAAALAALIAVGAPGTVAAGPVITIPGAYAVRYARVGTIGTAIKPVSQQEKFFQVTVWADTPENRDALGAALIPALSNTIVLDMPDGTYAHVQPRSATNLDRSQVQGAYRRDMVYSVEFTTTLELDAPQLLAVPIDLKNPLGEVIAQTLE